MFLLCLSVLAAAWPLDTAAALAKQLEPTYRWFHQHPELSLQEQETAQRLAHELEARGAEVHTGIGGTGVMAILRNRARPKGPVVLYRADMDALPVTEATGLPYASKHVGVMHACGHDLHMTIALGVIDALRRHEDRWSGSVLFIGQPAEEIGQGARAIMADPRFGKILKKTGKPVLALALHDEASPVGAVSMRGGFAWANVDMVDVTFYGKGGHGARPHQTIDPVLMGSQYVTAIQSIVSRRLSPNNSAVVTVGSFQAGRKHNIISGEAKLLITVRSYGDEQRNFILGQLKEIAGAVAKAHGAPKKPSVSWGNEYTRSVWNDPKWNERLMVEFRTLLGPNNVHTHDRFFIGEDFGAYGPRLGIPSVLYMLGAANAKRYRAAKDPASLPGLHSERWAPDTVPALTYGIATMTRAIATASAN
ncbi:MAG: amidohydrolase [Myxococcota bacterium]